MSSRRDFLTLGVSLFALSCESSPGEDTGLIGYWKLRGDCQDHSGKGNHGINRSVNLETAEFNGAGAYIEIPDTPALKLGADPFSISAWIHTEAELTDVIGDIVSKYDPATRQGFQLSVSGATSGYNSTSDVRNVYFGVDDGKQSGWSDCGRPNPKSHNSDALTVFEGSLYASSTDAKDPSDWAHAYRYKGGQDWEDCGRVGGDATRGAYTMIVHRGALYAATSASHGQQPASVPFGRVYRYQGGREWEDLGQPGENRRLHSLASFGGRLYVVGFNIGYDPPFHCYVYEGAKQWRMVKEFDHVRAWPHATAVHDGKLFVGTTGAEVHSFDGEAWEFLGNPFGSHEIANQIHSLGVYRGELYVGTWPLGKVARLSKGHWEDLGRLGDATEVVGLAAFNGKLYAGTIPRAEVFRFDEGKGWQSMGRLFAPEGWEPVPVGSKGPEVADWSRASSLALFGGKLFCSSATCYRTNIERALPDEVRGRVFAMEAGKVCSYDRDLGAGWKHVTAVRDADGMKLYVDGELKVSTAVKDAGCNVANGESLKIGFGELDYFSGRIREVRLYNRALSVPAIQRLRGEGTPQ